ncbi:MAG TPA: peptidase MA family metallohydrolase [Anaerolineae bacterium]|nr:peptidase MA family metallohydrolase [Anaerolineae bacterium]
MSTPLTARLRRLARAALLLAVLTVGARAAPARAQGVQVLKNTVAVNFGRNITFALNLAAGTRVNAVTLYYQKVGEGLTLRVPLEVQPGQTSFEHIWKLQPGDVPVGAQMEYHWRLVDSANSQVRLEPVHFTYDDDRFKWQLAQRDNVLLHWYGTNQSRADRLLGYAVDALARLQTEMGVTVDRDINIYVYDTKADMSLALPGKSDAFDDRILTLGVVVDDATLLILGSHQAVKGTMAHELTHVVVGLATDNPYAELPRWLDEGLAMVSEGALPGDNQRELDAAVRGDRLISVHSLSGYTGNPDEVDLFYGEAHSLVSFMLRTFGKDKIGQLLGAIKEGLYQEEALRRVYGFGLDELDTRWRASLGLGPRPTPGKLVPVTPVPLPTPSPATRPGLPCPLSWLTGLLGVGLVFFQRRHAGAA